VTAPRFAALLLSAALLAATARAETVVEDPGAYRLLSASKACALQWVDKPALGTVVVEGDPKSTLKIRCTHVSENGKTYLKMQGDVVKITAQTFVFKGTILVKQETDLDPQTFQSKPGVECRREGVMTFARRGRRRFWRLQEPDMTNPCNKTTDYVDIRLP
jgi:hypothetical protein